jgi:cytochrome c oxidase subunit II
MPRWLQWLRNLMPLPTPASAQAAATDTIIVLAHVLMFVVFAGWLAYFVYVLIRFRRRRQPVARYAGARGRSARLVETGIIIAEAVLLIAFALPAWAVRAADPPADATVIQVVAEQFAWNVHYPGPDGIFGRAAADLVSIDNPLGLDPADPAGTDDVVLLNELNLPDDTPVRIELSSKDVIHSLSLPQMRVKQDAVPGLPMRVWFQPTRTTPPDERWEINCSQLCGLGHYRMRAFYRVMPRADFDAWLRDELKDRSR